MGGGGADVHTNGRQQLPVRQAGLAIRPVWNERLRVGNPSIDPDSFKAFLETIAPGGDYDRVLRAP